MADTKNFRVEYVINVTSNEVINSSGKIVANALTAVDTDDISEGTSNTYFTTTKVDTHLADSSSQKTINNAQIDGGTF